MLSDTDLLAGIDAGTYGITYSFLRAADGSFTHRQPALDPQKSAEALEFFKSNVTRSRIALVLVGLNAYALTRVMQPGFGPVS